MRTFVLITCVAAATVASTTEHMNVSQNEPVEYPKPSVRFLAEGCPDFKAQYPDVPHVELVQYVCDFWPESKWGKFPMEIVGNLVKIAQEGSLTKLLEECKGWMAEAANGDDFCWKKYFEARPDTGVPAKCVGTGLEGETPGALWKCWRNCDAWCSEQAHTEGGTNTGAFCACSWFPAKHIYRGADPVCEEGFDLTRSKCYGKCPTGFHTNSLFSTRCSTDCSQNKNGLTKSCGLGCTKDGYNCASTIFNMIAEAGEAALSIIAATTEDEQLAKATNSISKVLEVTANTVEKTMEAVSKFDNGEKQLHRMTVLGAVMSNFYREFGKENKGVINGAIAYRDAVVEMIDALNDGKDKYSGNVQNIIENATSNWSDVAEDLVDLFEAFYHPLCK